MNPVCRHHEDAVLPRSMFVKWFNSNIVPWQKNPMHSEQEDLDFRTYLQERLHNIALDDLTERIFSHVKHCTPEQLQTLQQTMASGGYEFNLNHVDYAVVELAEEGSLPKLKALYPTLKWPDLVDNLGVHESMSGKHMPQYADDMVTYFRETPMDEMDRDSGALCLFAALQQNPLETKKVVEVMQTIVPPCLQEHSNLIQATDNTVSLLYDTPVELVQHKAQELANQLQRLHEGWGIRYPAALLTLIMQERHNKTYEAPNADMLQYATGAEDFQLANLLRGRSPSPSDDEAPVVGRIRMMQQLYEPEMIMSAMLHGEERFIAPAEVYQVPIEDGLFQDVGHP